MRCECKALKCSHSGVNCQREAVQDLAGRKVCEPCADNYRPLSLDGSLRFEVRTIADMPLVGARPESFRIVAIDHAVMRGDECLCIARSNSMARRIANALMAYEPNSRGV